MLYNELPVAFPWYDKLEKQNRYNEHTVGVCDYQLISPADALLPFQFYKIPEGLNPVSWEVFEINTKIQVANLNSSIPLLDRTVREAREYITYFGQPLTSLALGAGYYYSRLGFPNGNFYYSEMFHVPESLFYIGADSDIEFMKMVWYHNNDLRPIFYNNKDGFGVPKFKNVIYLDTFITSSEPEIVEDGDRDGNDELIVTFQKVTIPHKITVVVPDFIKKALIVMAMHNVILIKTKGGIREGEIENIKITSTPEASGSLFVVDILFRSDVAIIAKGCADNMS